MQVIVVVWYVCGTFCGNALVLGMIGDPLFVCDVLLISLKVTDSRSFWTPVGIAAKSRPFTLQVFQGISVNQ